MTFYAHSTAALDKHDWQGLADHLRQVAALAEAYGRRLGIGRAAFLAGLLHDLGKYNPDFQAYIAGRGQSQSVDHSTAGAAIVGKLVSAGEDRYIAELIAFAIAGHHAGLPDRLGPERSLDGRLRRFVPTSLDPNWETELASDIGNSRGSLFPDFGFGDKAGAPFRFSLLGRMLFSCLVDADFRNTERFYGGIEGRTADRDWPALQALLPAMTAALDARFAELAGGSGPINRLRGDILAHVRSRAAEPRGLFTLTVPTGGGKTLASLAFALDHARRHGHERIIYAIPYTSIIDQTAGIFRGILGAENVLEHHSAIEEEKLERRELRDKLKLAMEDWAAPLVVTTTVQLFESLFASRPGRARKLHNIANAIIILDEAQTLPRPLLAPCVRVIDELARAYGCSIVLCTATQPALGGRALGVGHPLGLNLAGRELAPDPPKLAEQLRRTTIRRAGPLDNAQLVEALAEAERGLVIVNSRRHALALFQEAKAAALEGVIHLTTRQCAAHRRKILADIRQRLQDEAPCRVVATSLIEAGVDVDFPRVWRAETGLDQIAQSAGRCNREGRWDPNDSIVTVFSAPDYPPPPEIASLIKDMDRAMKDFTDAELLEPAAVEAFFREVYWRLDTDLDRENIVASFRIGRQGADFPYRTVAEKFRMIDSGMAPIIVPFDDTARKAIADLANPKIPSGALARDLQTYVVQVPPRVRTRLLSGGGVAFAVQDLRLDQFAVLAKEKLYDPNVGLLWEEKEPDWII